MPKILVADDNTNIQKMVALAFEERGIDVVAVGNGEAAVRRIPDMNPDLVLADIFMPVRNGYEVCEFVKKDGRFSHVPVILLVGAFDPLDEKEARRVGADGVLKKPFVPPDPLIAMVIAALEKNPKLAAELAKAKEVVPEPEPLPAALAAPAKAEVKPLPKFPEPTPEEAALVYGFGSGKRGNEDLSAEPKEPIALEGDAEEEEDDSEAGTHDWRRSAMDFEIPEETSKSTAFALDDETATAMFPSEKDVPPKHVRVHESAKAFVHDIPAQFTAPAIAPEPPEPLVAAAPPVAPVAAAIVSAAPLAPVKVTEERPIPVSATTWGDTPVAPSIDAPIAPQNALEVADPAKSSTEARPSSEKVQEPFVDAMAHSPALEIEPVSDTVALAPRAAHWMDVVTAGLKEPEPAAHHPAEPTPPVEAKLDAAPEPPAPIIEASEPVIVAQANNIPDELPVYAAPVQPEDEQFFADDEQSSTEWLAVVPAETKKVEVAAIEPTLEASGPVAVNGLASDPEFVAEPQDSGPIAKDPALVEPPSVRVTPEPLLVDETTETFSSDYDKREAPTEPPFAFTEPSEPEPSVSAPAEVSNSTEAAPEDMHANERIPTGPPPNREILATIPFLSPPPEFFAPAAEENKAEDADVDAVVRKVLEKLEPQLHNLLSQGLLKPLVENIIQNDLAKKGR